MSELLPTIDEVLKNFAEEAVLIITDGNNKYQHVGDSEDLWRNEVEARAHLEKLMAAARLDELKSVSYKESGNRYIMLNLFEKHIATLEKTVKGEV